MDESRKNNVEWETPDVKEYILCDLSCVKLNNRHQSKVPDVGVVVIFREAWVDYNLEEA